jgi:PI-3-kinase-related kinase SMG-1
MTNLSKANAILFPLEACLSADVTVMSEAISKEREKNNGSMPLIHGKALYQSYSIKIREACKNIEPLLGPLTENVEGLHSMVMKLGHLSSLHAGNLHKALEVPGERESVRSQDIPSTHPDLLQSDSSTEKVRDSSENMGCGSPDLEMNTDVSLQDGCWISPPEHSYTSSSGCTTGLTQNSSSDNLEKIHALMDVRTEIEDPVATDQETRDGSDDHSISSAVALTHASNIHEVETQLVEGRIESDNNSAVFKQVRGQECENSDPKSYADSSIRVTRGKNPFALSILKQVEHKLHGRDIDGTRSLNISEQVDYLLKQATSIDNLCNMYEGWTPWI